MPGGGGLAEAFSHALLLQGLLVALIFALLGGGWVAVRAGDTSGHRFGASEPAWRAVLRIGFGIVWIFDGILQAQPAIPADFPGEVLRPAAASSPHWAQGLVDWAAANWSHHPVPSAAATVWIQVGVGVFLLAMPPGASPRIARAAGLISAAWGLVVWIFGEAVGGIFAPGQSWLLGTPGAAAYYVVAGLLVAAPATPRLGRAMCAGTGIFLLGMAVLQAWPGRGFWQGTADGQPGPLADSARSMAQLPQPGWLSGLVRAFAGLDQAHGFAVNLVAVTALALVGAAFLLGGTRTVRPGLVALAVLGLADWVCVQDLGFFGGLGTDPNSMPLVILLASAAYLALVAEPATTTRVTPAHTTPAQGGVLSTARRHLAEASFRSIVAAGAAAMVLLGIVPLVVTQLFTLPG